MTFGTTGSGVAWFKNCAATVSRTWEGGAVGLNSLELELALRTVERRSTCLTPSDVLVAIIFRKLQLRVASFLAAYLAFLDWAFSACFESNMTEGTLSCDL